MASFKTFSHSNHQYIVNVLRHNWRETLHHSTNPDIDPNKSSSNINYTPNRHINSYAYYKKLLEKYTYYHRNDVKTMVECIVTEPVDLPKTEEQKFFDEVNHYLSSRFGGEQLSQYGVKDNELVVSSVVHSDESGQPHLHFDFVPVVYDEQKQKLKICKKEVVNRPMLLHFHDDLQSYLDSKGLHAHVHTGITREQGGNRSIEELKAETARTKERLQQVQKRNRHRDIERD